MIQIDDLSDRLRLGMAKMQAAIGETSAAASGRMITLEEVRNAQTVCIRCKKYLKTRTFDANYLNMNLSLTYKFTIPFMKFIISIIL